MKEIEAGMWWGFMEIQLLPLLFFFLLTGRFEVQAVLPTLSPDAKPSLSLSRGTDGLHQLRGAWPELLQLTTASGFLPVTSGSNPGLSGVSVHQCLHPALCASPKAL